MPIFISVPDGQFFVNAVKAEVLKLEHELRSKLQIENKKHMETMELRYKNVNEHNLKIINTEREKYKKQEIVFRQQFAKVLSECGRKMTELENENMKLMKQSRGLFNECNIYKTNANMYSDRCQKMIAHCKLEWEVKLLF